MKRIIIVGKWWYGKRFDGMAIWPFVFVKHKGLVTKRIFINHERIHLRQQFELGILPFYVWYLLEYMVRVFKYKNRHKAYRNICFEREAYACENQLDYLQNRRTWSFLNYL